MKAMGWIFAVLALVAAWQMMPLAATILAALSAQFFTYKQEIHRARGR